MKTFLILLALAFPMLGQVAGSTYLSIPDITGMATTVPLSATHVYCIQAQINALPTNLSLVRYGGSTTSISAGAFIAAGGGQTEVQQNLKPVDLANLYVYVASGDKVTVTCKQ